MMVWCLLLSLDVCANAQEGQIKHVLIVAVSDYPQEADWPLIPFSVQSAKTFLEQASQHFQKRQSRLFLNEQATAEKVKEALRELAGNTSSGERVLLYLSGLGSVDEKGFLSFEGFQAKGEKAGRSRIPMSQLAPEMPKGGELLMIADLTLARGATGDISALGMPPGPVSYIISIRDPAQHQGGHGQFTQYLLKGFAKSMGEGGLALDDLVAYLRDVKEQKKGHGELFIRLDSDIKITAPAKENPAAIQVAPKTAEVDKDEPDFWEKNLKTLPVYEELQSTSKKAKSAAEDSAKAGATVTAQKNSEAQTVLVGVIKSSPAKARETPADQALAELEEKGVKQTGSIGPKPVLNVKTIPSRAIVNINPEPEKWDKEQAITPLRIVLEKKTSYTIKVTRGGYEPVSRTITFDRGGEFDLELQLQRMPIMARLNSLIRPARGSNDSYGNPVVRGTDQRTGLYLEVVELKTGMHLVLISGMAVMEGGESFPGAAYIGKYEVTNLEYEYFRSNHSIHRGKQYFSKVVSQSDDNPVIMVSWHDAWKFCLWMSHNDIDLFRLPFANEWSQVYRKGFLGQQRRTKKINEDYGKYANFPDRTAQLRFNWDWEPATTDPYSTTAPVGKMRPNAASIYHMDGNVWEWMQDSMNSESEQRQSRLCVGGSWLDRPAGLGPANRTMLQADDEKITVGFRVILPIILD
ncbi:MAG: SUMF1/EgtB/PvdO family nonheme iron enzyme [Planctomycetota bacterium]|nr:SUMF1/EgtB/PvdO family nonheme iron enzyme [Planctomycetota bacterium]